MELEGLVNLGNKAKDKAKESGIKASNFARNLIEIFYIMPSLWSRLEREEVLEKIKRCGPIDVYKTFGPMHYLEEIETPKDRLIIDRGIAGLVLGTIANFGLNGIFNATNSYDLLTNLGYSSLGSLITNGLSTYHELNKARKERKVMDEARNYLEDYYFSNNGKLMSSVGSEN